MSAILEPVVRPALNSPVVAVTPKRAAGFYRPELDGLRFCSFLAVFISHECLRVAECW